MATVSVVNSTDMGIYILDTTYKKVNHCTDASIEFTHSPRDITTKDSAGYRELLEGLRSWTVSGSALFAFDATYGVEELEAAARSRTLLTLIFTTNTSGDTYLKGSAYVSSVSRSSADAEGNVTASFSLEGTGAITEATRT